MDERPVEDRSEEEMMGDRSDEEQEETRSEMSLEEEVEAVQHVEERLGEDAPVGTSSEQQPTTT